jgi:hypothetical protein
MATVDAASPPIVEVRQLSEDQLHALVELVITELACRRFNRMVEEAQNA